jgi:mono/diheme cytochrome c family protein
MRLSAPLLAAFVLAPATLAAGLAPTTLSAQRAKTGAEVYATCAACHMANGQGLVGAFPPLAGSDWVTGRADVPIALVLHGMQGPVPVKGVTYNAIMTPWGELFTDEEIANVVTYIRTNWGNAASAVTAADVAKVRAATKGRRAPFTAEEVRKQFP